VGFFLFDLSFVGFFTVEGVLQRFFVLLSLVLVLFMVFGVGGVVFLYLTGFFLFLLWFIGVFV